MSSMFTRVLGTLGLLFAVACGGYEDGNSDQTTPEPDTNTQQQAINGCTTFVDHSGSADARALTWSFSIASDPSRCMTVKVGQTVEWDGSFASHPIAANDGDSPSPIASMGTSGTATFEQPGVYGYQCTVHGSMKGAIQVIE